MNGAILILVACCLAVASANPSDTRHLYHHQDTHKLGYDFGYQHSDAYTGNHQGRKETRDSYGNVHGSYNLVEPDGSVRVVEYSAGPYTGFVAHVKDKFGVQTFGAPGAPVHYGYHSKGPSVYPAPPVLPHHPHHHHAPAYGLLPKPLPYLPKPLPYHAKPALPYLPPRPVY